MQRIRVLIAEDHNLVRSGLINMLESYSDIYIIGEADNGQNLIDKFQELKPDIVLTDISMPQMSGMMAAKKILAINRNAKIIFLTAFQEDEQIYKAVNIGASGLLSKESMKGELINAIRTVANGDKYFAGKSGEEIVAIINRFHENKLKEDSNKYYLLNERDKEILLYIAQGLSSDEIAQKMNLGKRAVDNSRSEIMKKLDLKNLPQLIKFAVDFSFNEKGEIN